LWENMQAQREAPESFFKFLADCREKSNG
jgi:hypothetical protein